MAAGTALVTLGASTITATVTAPTTIPSHLQWLGEVTDCQKSSDFGVPRYFGIWLRMMTSPTPLRYPLTTGYGMYLMSLPSPMAPKAISKTPHSTATMANISTAMSGPTPLWVRTMASADITAV